MNSSDAEFIFLTNDWWTVVDQAVIKTVATLKSSVSINLLKQRFSFKTILDCELGFPTPCVLTYLSAEIVRYLYFLRNFLGSMLVF